MARSALYCIALLVCLAGLVHADHHLGNYKNKNKNAQQQQEEEMNDDDDLDLYNPRDALIKYLLRRASPRVPPPPQYLPIAVQVKLRPLAVRNVCPKTYTVEMPTLEMYNWTDPRLAWNASDFGDVHYIDISPRDIWMPDIAVWQSPGSTPMQTRPKEYNAVVTSDGNVLYIPVSELSISCDATPWKEHNKAQNKKGNRTTSSGSNHNQRSGMHSSEKQHTQDQQASEARQLREARDSDVWMGTRTYLCEFDQGPWIYDLSVVNVIPVSTGTPFHEHNETGTAAGGEGEEDQPQNDESSTTNEDDVVQKSDRGTRRADHQHLYPAEDFDATADLSWYDGNEHYDIVSFTSEHFIERYTSFPVDWSSIHYRLLVKANSQEIGRMHAGRFGNDDDDDEEEEKARKKQKKQAAKRAAAPIVQKKNAKTPLHRSSSVQQAEDTTDTENDD